MKHSLFSPCHQRSGGGEGGDVGCGGSGGCGGCVAAVVAAVAAVVVVVAVDDAWKLAELWNLLLMQQVLLL